MDPESVTGRALVQVWTWNERPDRRFVSYAFVEACRKAGRLLPDEEFSLKLAESQLLRTIKKVKGAM